MTWLPIELAPLGEKVMLWHLLWRTPLAGRRIDENGIVCLDCQPDGLHIASHFCFMRLPA
jgi:hypothetical protein